MMSRPNLKSLLAPAIIAGLLVCAAAHLSAEEEAVKLGDEQMPPPEETDDIPPGASGAMPDAGYTKSDAGTGSPDAGTCAPCRTEEEKKPDRSGEVDLIDLILKVAKSKKDREAPSENRPWKIHLAGLPYISYQPATSLQFGVAGNAGWYTGDISTTSISEAMVSVAYTLRNQLLISARSIAFTKDNKMNIQGDWRFNMTNQDTWGLGPMMPNRDSDLIDFNWVRFYETFYFSIARRFYAGIGVNIDYQFSIVDNNVRAGKHSFMADYYGGNEPSSTRAIGLSAGLLYDTRDNQINPSRGFLMDASLKVFPSVFGSDNTFESLWLEFRAYPRLGWNNILAFWFWGWFSFGFAPYLDLPAIGWDMYNKSGRGYTQGRIRAKNILYFEAEYRIRLMKNDLIGMVIFVNGTAAADPDTGQFSQVNPAGGIGGRVKINRKSETNLSVDIGFGERESLCFYIGVQEAF